LDDADMREPVHRATAEGDADAKPVRFYSGGGARWRVARAIVAQRSGLRSECEEHGSRARHERPQTKVPCHGLRVRPRCAQPLIAVNRLRRTAPILGSITRRTPCIGTFWFPPTGRASR